MHAETCTNISYVSSETHATFQVHCLLKVNDGYFTQMLFEQSYRKL